ncbi:MAG: zinc metalloprotease [Acidobacteria bacterium]|nr:zinc metalloprotease [Acidobacteriota bacterium]
MPKKESAARTRRTCGAMAAHMMLLEQYPSFRAAQMRLEGVTARRRDTGADPQKATVATIKTIVHVVYNTAEQNISDAQINSQFVALNKDFRATNPDKSQTPVPFKGFVTDARVQFKLVQVTRTKTGKISFTSDDQVKKASTGGIAPTTPKTHLNLWVCPMGGGLLGYAQFPGGPPATDGVVINYKAFGTNGTAAAPFKKGRSATHEIGHYFNLRHIWGDTPDCSGSDMVADTPNCAGPNFGTPPFPTVTCNNGPNGDMFMNYMDYTDDAAMFMFTSQQVLRMRAALESVRSGLL